MAVKDTASALRVIKGKRELSARAAGAGAGAGSLELNARNKNTVEVLVCWLAVLDRPASESANTYTCSVCAGNSSVLLSDSPSSV